MKITLNKNFKSRTQGRFGKYEFEVGVITDGPHNKALSKSAGHRSYAGGPIRKKSKRFDKLSTAQISEKMRKFLGFNYLTEPFKTHNPNNSEILRFTSEFFKLCFGRSTKKRCENLLQAIVRNPILRRDYGPNSRLRIEIKGFDRKMIDTAQLFKKIVAVCRVRSKRV